MFVWADSPRCATPVVELRARVSASPKDGEAWLKLARTLESLGEEMEATDAFQKAVEFSPKDRAAAREYGIAMANTGIPAVAHFEKLVVSDSKDLDAAAGLAFALTMSGEPDKGAAEASRILKIKSDFAPAHYQLGLALQAKEDYEGARAEYAAAAKFDPRFAAAHYAVGAVAWRMGDADATVASLKAAIALKPDAADAYSMLGGALRRKGDLEGAQKALEQATALDPDNPVSFSTLAQVLRMRGDIEGSKKMLAEGTRLQQSLTGSKTAMFHINAGREKLRTSDYAAAEKQLRNAVQAAPDNACAHRNLSRALKGQGNTAESTKESQVADDLEARLCARKPITRFPMLRAHGPMAP